MKSITLNPNEVFIPTKEGNVFIVEKSPKFFGLNQYEAIRKIQSLDSGLENQILSIEEYNKIYFYAKEHEYLLGLKELYRNICGERNENYWEWTRTQIDFTEKYPLIIVGKEVDPKKNEFVKYKKVKAKWLPKKSGRIKKFDEEGLGLPIEICTSNEMDKYTKKFDKMYWDLGIFGGYAKDLKAVTCNCIWLWSIPTISCEYHPNEKRDYLGVRIAKRLKQKPTILECPSDKIAYSKEEINKKKLNSLKIITKKFNESFELE